MLGRFAFFSDTAQREGAPKKTLSPIRMTLVPRTDLVVNPSDGTFLRKSTLRLSPLLAPKTLLLQKCEIAHAATQTEDASVNTTPINAADFEDSLNRQYRLMMEKDIAAMELAAQKKSVETMVSRLFSNIEISSTSLQSSLGSLEGAARAYPKEKDSLSQEPVVNIKKYILPDLIESRRRLSEFHERAKDGSKQQAVAEAVAQTKVFYEQKLAQQYATITSELEAQYTKSLQFEQKRRKEERTALKAEIEFLKREFEIEKLALKAALAHQPVHVLEFEYAPVSTKEKAAVESLEEECHRLRSQLQKAEAIVEASKSALPDAQAREKLSHNTLIQERAAYSEWCKEEGSQRVTENKEIETARNKLITEIFAALKREASSGMQAELIASIIQGFEAEHAVVSNYYSNLIRRMRDTALKREKQLIELLDTKIGLITDGFIRKKEIDPTTLGVLNDEILKLQSFAAKAQVEGLHQGRVDATNSFRQVSAVGIGLSSVTKGPTGTVTLVFTDVQDSTKLWDQVPTDMEFALTVHDSLMRTKIRQYNGYEVKTEGDAFMVAFGTTINAVQWCVDIQKVLCANDSWPDSLAMASSLCKRERDSKDTIIWNGLRVRMGVHVGEPLCRMNRQTQRMDYYGPMVNLSARISGSAQGGQIVASSKVMEIIKETKEKKHSDFFESIAERSLGPREFKGITGTEVVYEILPMELVSRSKQFQ